MQSPYPTSAYSSVVSWDARVPYNWDTNPNAQHYQRYPPAKCELVNVILRCTITTNDGPWSAMVHVGNHVGRDGNASDYYVAMLKNGNELNMLQISFDPIDMTQGTPRERRVCIDPSMHALLPAGTTFSSRTTSFEERISLIFSALKDTVGTAEALVGAPTTTLPGWDARDPYDWTSAPSAGDIRPYSAQAAERIRALLNSTIPLLNERPIRMTHVMTEGGQDFYAALFGRPIGPIGSTELNIVQVRFELSNHIIQYYERRIQIDESMQALLPSSVEVTSRQQTDDDWTRAITLYLKETMNAQRPGLCRYCEACALALAMGLHHRLGENNLTLRNLDAELVAMICRMAL